jgi:serine/threonine protein kinase
MNYTLKSELGEGGMATVFLAHDNKFDTEVAIKVLNKEFVHNENIRKRFIAEARKMFKMSHPNIIKVRDLIEEDDSVAFVMEYIEGETLKQYIERKGKLSDGEIKDLFTQMLDAVGYVHEQNLVHRDIKPSNFMINIEGGVKLMDFGIAKTTDASSAEYTQTGTGVQMGTPMYMSPEQITESKSVTSQSDIYSLGVVLWQMVTGKKPYDTQVLSTFKLQTKIVQEPLSKTNTTWDKLIQKATEKKILQRYVSCLDIKVELNNPRKKGKLGEENTVLVQKDDSTVIEKFDSNKKNINPKSKVKTISQTPRKNKNLNQEIAQESSNSSSLFQKIGIIALIAILVFGVLLWMNYKKPLDDNVIVKWDDDTRISHPADAVNGDFNGDGKLDYMWLEKPKLSPDGSECIGECISYIKFDDPSIPSIEVLGSIGGIPSNQGDLNKNGTDEIGLLPDWFTSCWRDYHVWTFKNGAWISAVEPFPTHCNQWENGIKPIEIDLNRNGNVIIRYSESNSDFEIVTKSKSINVVN